MSVSMVASAATRLSPDKHHYISFSGAAGYSSWLNNLDKFSPANGVSAELGVGYRVNYNGFLIELGVGGNYGYYAHTVPNAHLQIPMHDTEDDSFTMLASMTECRDWNHVAGIEVPLLLGYEYERFYFMVGAKAGFALWGSSYSSAMLKTRGEYDRFEDIFVDMPNHQLIENSKVESGRLKLQLLPSVMAHAEIGARIDRFKTQNGVHIANHNYRLYLAVFADYGFLNIHKPIATGNTIDYRETEDKGVQFYVLPMMLSSQMENAKVMPLTVGIKFTALVELPQKKICIHCD